MEGDDGIRDELEINMASEQNPHKSLSLYDENDAYGQKQANQERAQTSKLTLQGPLESNRAAINSTGLHAASMEQVQIS